MFSTVTLHADGLVAAMAPTHPLATQESVTFEELSRSKCVIRHSIQQLLRALHCPASVMSRIEVRDNGDFDRLRRLSAIRFGNFTSIFYQSDLLPMRLTGVKLVPIKNQDHLPLVASYSKNRPLPAQHKMLISFLQQALSAQDYDFDVWNTCSDPHGFVKSKI